MNPIPALRALAVALALTAVSLSSALAQTSGEATPSLTPLIAEVVAAPRSVPGSDGLTHLVYELRIANMTGAPVRILELETLDAETGQVVGVLGADALAQRVTPGANRGHETAELTAYQFAVVFLHVALRAGDPVPTRLVHMVEAHFDAIDKNLTMRMGETAVVDEAPPVLGPPLRGSGYVAADGCCDSIRHVRALLPLDGKLVLAQRFAIDWEQVDDQNRLVQGDIKKPENYEIYGEAVVAVADGKVVAARNDLADQVPGALPPNLPLDEADGNFAVIDIGSGAYALYAHMRPGTVKVAAGDIVRRGDVIGEVGNTGNSQAPHLHFHVMDGANPLASNGLPYVFDAFAITAVDEAGTEDFDKAEATGSALTLTPRNPPTVLKDVLPLDLSVVDWR